MVMRKLSYGGFNLNWWDKISPKLKKTTNCQDIAWSINAPVVSCSQGVTLLPIGFLRENALGSPVPLLLLLFPWLSWAAVGCELLLNPISEGSGRSQRRGLVWASPWAPCVLPWGCQSLTWDEKALIWVGHTDSTGTDGRGEDSLLVSHPVLPFGACEGVI